MRIKRLEVQGFKSFKDKTVIHFDHSITGIVGPNGCGKSNIVDAFFWVMGEQSYKHIRGSGAEDLIFNGSSKYSPLGFAEATLVMELDTVDTSKEPTGASATDAPQYVKTKEISVTRRVYRSGEGEYFVNNVPARLKDIHELFMDTGVGAKGYSIIEQGQIGKIVNAKPEDRRLIIEEAAGIAKYKARKKESLRKLEAAEGNLTRLADVIQEIERSLSSLERQAQKAEQYKKFRGELLEKEVTWGRRKHKVLSKRLVDLKEKRDLLDQECVGIRASLQTEETSTESDRIGQLTLSKTVESLQSEIQELAQDLTRTQSQLELSRRRQEDLANQVDTLSSERNDLELALSSEREKIEGLQSENESAAEVAEAKRSVVVSAEEEVRKLRGEFDLSRRSLDQVKQELLRGMNETSHLSNRAAGLESKIESGKIQLGRLSEQSEENALKLETLRTDFEVAESRKTDIEAKREELRVNLSEGTASVQTLEAELKTAKSAFDASSLELTRTKSRLQSLLELQSAHEGFGDGPKAILDWAKKAGKGSSLSALADGLKVQAGYEAALEGFLEGKLENLVTEEPALALEALREIQNGKKGRASIYISKQKRDATSLDSLKTSLISAGFQVEGTLSDFVSVAKDFSETGKKAAEILLNSAIVVKDFDALATWVEGNSLPASISLVSTSGLAFDSEGSLRGGSIQSDQQGSLLGRKRAIAELEAAVATLEGAAAENEARFQAITIAVEGRKSEISELKTELQTIEIEFATVNRDVQQFGRTLQDLENQKNRLMEQVSALEDEIQSQSVDLVQAKSEIDSAIQQKAGLEAQISELEAGFYGKEETLRTAESELARERVEEASVAERAKSISRELDAGMNLIRDRERRLADVERALTRVTSENEEHSGGDSEFLVKVEELTVTIGQKREGLAGYRDQLEILSGQVNGAMSRMKELHQLSEQKNHETTQLSLDIERITTELSFLIQNLEEKYGQGCLEAPALAPIQEEMEDPVVTLEMNAVDEATLNEEVEKLREKIRRLGEVNVMAIEEFEEKKKRYDYLIHERQDLTQSITDLNDAIEHINKTSEERFRKAFEAVADRFERLFPIIFGGGQAKLSLVYPENSEDILEAGIDILAQPPGKKVVNIGLLSGGEKALTAVSLIFAIFMVKPSPFCILDEVDAPLDDANIGKFNALLREMSVKSQFIIITHNKKTMELNDTLYGVTMEEPGVSKMVSIEMRA
jgi:chromosome segregation protein